MPNQSIPTQFSSGPFDDQLSLRYKAPANPAGEAGWGGGLTTAAHAATQFLEGMSRARLTKMAQNEMQRQRNISALSTMMQQAENSDMTPEAKRKFNEGIAQRLAVEVGGASTGDKKTDSSHPVIGFFKGLANSIVGPSTGKVAPIDHNYIGQKFMEMGQQPTVKDVTSQAFGKVQDAMNEYAMRDRDGSILGVRSAVWNDPRVLGAFDSLSQHGIAVPDSWKLAMGRVLSPEQEIQYREQSAINDYFKGGGQPTAGQGASPQPSPTTAPVPQQPSPAASVASAQTSEPPRPISDTAPANPNHTTLSFPWGQNGGAATQVTPQTIAVTTPSADSAAPSFLTGRIAPSGVITALGNESRRKFGATGVEERWMVDQHNRGNQYPIRVFAASPGYGYDLSGKEHDLSKINGTDWMISKTPPAPKITASPDQIKGFQASFDDMERAYPHLKGMFGASFNAALASDNPTDSVKSVFDRMQAYQGQYEMRQQAAHEAASRVRESTQNSNRYRVAKSLETLPTRIAQGTLFKGAEQSTQIASQVTAAYEKLLTTKDEGAKKALYGSLDRMLGYAKGKLSDAGSTVREGEIKFWQEVMGRIETMKTRIAGMAANDGRLYNEATRRELVSQVRDTQTLLRKIAWRNEIQPKINGVKMSSEQLGVKLTPDEIDGLIPEDYRGFMGEVSSPAQTSEPPSVIPSPPKWSQSQGGAGRATPPAVR